MNSASKLPVFSSVAVANAFVEMNQSGGDLTPSKLHDLCFLAHAWHAAQTGQGLLADGAMADRDGVFEPELRDAGCRGPFAVREPVSRFVTDSASGFMREETPVVPATSPIRVLIKQVWARWGGLPAYELREVMREIGSPWDLIWNDEDRIEDDPRRIPFGTTRLWARDRLMRERSSAPNAINGSDRAANDLDATQQMLTRPDPARLRAV